MGYTSSPSVFSIQSILETITSFTFREAIAHTDRAIQDARRRGDTTINLIVGMCIFCLNLNHTLRYAAFHYKQAKACILLVV
jgi:hypothetical protein